MPEETARENRLCGPRPGHRAAERAEGVLQSRRDALERCEHALPEKETLSVAELRKLGFRGSRKSSRFSRMKRRQLRNPLRPVRKDAKQSGLGPDYFERDDLCANAPVGYAFNPREALLRRFDRPFGAAGKADRDRSLAGSDHRVSPRELVKKMHPVRTTRRVGALSPDRTGDRYLS